MVKPLYANNAFSTLASGIDNSQTSITVATGEGARFPSIAGSDYFYATIFDTSNNIEIVKVTAKFNDVFTVVRGQDGTTAKAFSATDRIEARVNAAAISEGMQGGYLDNASIPANVIDTAQLVDASVTAEKLAPGAASPEATVAEIRNGTAGKVITPANVESALEEVTITEAGAWSWDSGLSFYINATTNVFLAFPTNVEPGTWRTVRVRFVSAGIPLNVSSGTGYWTIDGSALNLQSTTNSMFMLHLYAMTTSSIFVTAVGPMNAR